jgi:hypothetical protein
VTNSESLQAHALSAEKKEAMAWLGIGLMDFLYQRE